MIFYLHYILLTSGLSGTNVLIGVFFKLYSDASQAEIGALLMSFPFSSLIIKPLFCSMADKKGTHCTFLIWSLVVLIIGYVPFIAVPYYPEFYEQHPRFVWYFLVISCFIGNLGLAVAWSLGDSLAVNIAAKRGQPFSRYRMFGTISWGVYGYIIGQINEHPAFPKYVPSFLILVVSVVLEIILLLLWNKEDFVMYDPDRQIELQDKNSQDKAEQQAQHLPKLDYDWTPSSVGGSLRMSPQVARALRDLVAADDQPPIKTQDLESNGQNDDKTVDDKAVVRPVFSTEKSQQHTLDHVALENELNRQVAQMEGNKNKSNPQIILFKMIMKEDGRLLKYMVFALVIGYLFSPMNFLFMSMEEVCKTKGCTFSHLAGSVLISQASIETIGFLVTPSIMKHVSRPVALTSILLLLLLRYVFYAFFYYTADISPYWALMSEWCHGIAFAVTSIILADVALVFASQCKFFLPEMKQLGFLKESDDKAKMQADENRIRMALRASMQAVFGGLMDGGGNGLGSLACGLVLQAFSYIALWQSMAIVAILTITVLLLVELTKSRYSDTYKPKAGTKAFEIRSIG